MARKENEKFIPKILKQYDFSNIYDLKKEVKKKNKGKLFDNYSSLRVDYYIDYDYVRTEYDCNGSTQIRGKLKISKKKRKIRLILYVNKDV